MRKEFLDGIVETVEKGRFQYEPRHDILAQKKKTWYQMRKQRRISERITTHLQLQMGRDLPMGRITTLLKNAQGSKP